MTDPTPSEQRRDRLAFYPVAVVGAIFCLTIFVVIAADFGAQQGPNPVNQWVRDHATGILLFETLLLVAMGLLAMFLDRIRTLQKSGTFSSEADVKEGGDDRVG